MVGLEEAGSIRIDRLQVLMMDGLEIFRQLCERFWAGWLAVGSWQLAGSVENLTMLVQGSAPR